MRGKSSLLSEPSSSALDDVDDLVGLRADDDVAAVYADHLIAAPLRIDLHDPRGKRVEPNVGRNGGANGNVEVHVGGFLDPLRPDGRDDLSPLLGGRSGSGRSRGVAGRRAARAAFLRLRAVLDIPSFDMPSLDWALSFDMPLLSLDC